MGVAAAVAAEYVVAEGDAVAADGWAWQHGVAVVGNGVAVVDGGVEQDDAAAAAAAEEHDVAVVEDDAVEKDDVVGVGDGVAVVAGKDASVAEEPVGVSSSLLQDRATYCSYFHDELDERVYYDEQGTHCASSSQFLSEKKSYCQE